MRCLAPSLTGRRGFLGWEEHRNKCIVNGLETQSLLGTWSRKRNALDTFFTCEVNAFHLFHTYTEALKPLIILTGDFPGGPVADSVLSKQGAQVQSLVRKLDLACSN